MTRVGWMLIVAGLVGTIGGLAAAQETQEKEKRSNTHPAGKNPHLNDKASIRAGMAIYRVRCGDCHGLDASGYRGPDLNAFAAANPDERIFEIIRKGVPGTEMPPTTAPDDDLLLIIAYLRNLGTPAASDKVAGNVDNGAKVFDAECAQCHRAAGRGGRIGPDLSRIGLARSRAALVREIRTPSEWIPPAYETVTLITNDGRKIRGVKKNEDVFTIQVMELRERLQGYQKSNLKEVIYEKTSLMPAFGPERLSDGDLNDVVAYLTTLKGTDVTVKAQ